MTTLRKIAYENTFLVCQEVYRLLLKEYRKNMDKNGVYSICLKYKHYGNYGKLLNGNILNDDINTLISINNTSNPEKIGVYEIPSFDNHTSNEIFNITNLIYNLTLEGIYAKDEFSYISVSIECEKLRQIIKGYSINNTQKRR